MEYSYKAIESAGTALGVKCSDGVILGVEKLVLSKMLVEGSGRRVHAVDEHVGAAPAGPAEHPLDSFGAAVLLDFGLSHHAPDELLSWSLRCPN